MGASFCAKLCEEAFSKQVSIWFPACEPGACSWAWVWEHVLDTPPCSHGTRPGERLSPPPAWGNSPVLQAGVQHGIFCHTCSLMWEGDKVLKCTVSTLLGLLGQPLLHEIYHAGKYNATSPNTCCTTSLSTSLLWPFLALSQGVIPYFSLFNTASWTVKVKLYWEYFCSKVIRWSSALLIAESDCFAKSCCRKFLRQCNFVSCFFQSQEPEIFMSASSVLLFPLAYWIKLNSSRKSDCFTDGWGL